MVDNPTDDDNTGNNAVLNMSQSGGGDYDKYYF